MEYTNLFKMCGYELGEIEREKPRIDKVFDMLELGPKDIQTALTTIPQNFDIELNGVRKLLRIWLEELLNLMLAKEEGKTNLWHRSRFSL